MNTRKYRIRRNIVTRRTYNIYEKAIQRTIVDYYRKHRLTVPLKQHGGALRMYLFRGHRYYVTEDTDDGRIIFAIGRLRPSAPYAYYCL